MRASALVESFGAETAAGFGEKLARLLAVISVVTIAFIWYRTGLVPASSTGDEVWASDSAWWFLHDGVLRRDIHADAIGSSIRDFLPPIPALGQALAFWPLGLSQFSMGVCSSIAFTAIVSLGYLVSRQLRLSKAQALMGAFSVGFIPASASQLLRVRYEDYVAMFVLLALYLLNLVRTGTRFSAGHHVRWVMAGMSFGMACLSYFGSSLGLGLCFASLVVPYCIRARNAGLLLAFCAGAGVVIASYGVFILGDLALFLTQMRESAAAYRGASFTLTMHTAMSLAFCVLLGGGILSLLRRRPVSSGGSGFLNTFYLPFAGTAILFWGMSDYYFPRYSLLATLFTVLSVSVLIAAQRNEQSPRYGRRFLIVLSTALYLSSMALVLGAVVAAVRQSRDRDYSAVVRDLGHNVNLSGLILTESPGWLALRPLTRRGQLHHLLPKVGDPSDLNSSTLLYDSKSAPKISSIVVRPDGIRSFRKDYPAVDAFMMADDVIGPIEIDETSHTYHLQLYRRSQTPVTAGPWAGQ